VGARGAEFAMPRAGRILDTPEEIEPEDLTDLRLLWEQGKLAFSTPVMYLELEPPILPPLKRECAQCGVGNYCSPECFAMAKETEREVRSEVLQTTRSPRTARAACVSWADTEEGRDHEYRERIKHLLGRR
jgi:hypothetical protein